MNMSLGIDKELFAAIHKLNDEQKQEVLAFVDGFTDKEGEAYDKWKDESFVAEMENEYNYYLNGGKVFSPEEVEKEMDELRNKLRRK